MKPSYLVDTDWIIHYLNGNKGIVEKIESLEKGGLAASCSRTYAHILSPALGT
jgi:hypothetical protein